MDLVGRAVELAVVARAVADVRAGAGRALGVLGEAGIGKSAVLAALGADARRSRLVVLEARGVEHERDVSFALAVEALDGREGLLSREPLAAVAGGDAAERVDHQRALRALIEDTACERPVALVLDDLHWADDASLELVLSLLRRPPAAPLLLAFAARPGDAALRLLDAARGVPGFAQLALGPLDHAASLAVLGELRDPELRARVAGAAAGNPLFLRELGRAARDPERGLPATLVAAVARELAALDGDARALAEGAAVAGDPFDPELATAAAGLDADVALAALDRLVAGDLVRADGTRRAFAFRHALVRRAVYDGIPPGRRLGAHERAAAALERRGAALAARAHHVERCARPCDERAIDLLTQAAAHATPDTAARWYDAALRLLPGDDRTRHAALLASMALALGAAGRLVAARDALVEALALSEAAPAASRLALVAACARIETELGQHADARQSLVDALGGAPREQRAELAFQLAAGAFYEGRVTQLRAWAEPAVRAAADAGDAPLLAGAEALAALGALWAADPRGAAGALERAGARFAALHDDAIRARPDAAVYVAVAQLHNERFPGAAAAAGRALAATRPTGQAGVLVPLLMTRAMARVQLLELDAALEDVEAGEQFARAQRVPRLLHFVLWLRALVQHQRGEAADAERAACECAALVGALEPSKLTRTGSCTLAALLADRQPERCLRESVAAGGTRLETADPTWSSWLLLRLVRASIATESLADAERWARQADKHSARLALPAGAVRAACARAELLLARGEPVAAAAIARDAAAAAELIPAPLDAAEARLLSGRAFAAARDGEAAKAALQSVAADAARGGALRLRDDAARELRRLGTRISGESRRAHGAGLNERERDIARLVADGHTNRQIAAALYLSEKTIANALTRIYARLGVRTRLELTRALDT